MNIRMALSVIGIITGVSLSAQLYTSEIEVTESANGNVGIGTDTPDAAWFASPSLQISGTRPTLSFTSTLTNGMGTIQWMGVTSQSQIHLNYWNETNSLSFYSYSAVLPYVLHIGGDGKIGINTSSPGYNLDVVGTFRNYDAVNGREFIVSPGSGTIDMYSTEFNINRFSNMNVVLADGGGKVGIDINAPTEKLHVNGNIRALAPIWADHVFSAEYDLPTLDQVESHIKENGHLKDIPSEKEVMENGINLGEMDALLLQKIEELTLYVIELNKKISRQQETIQQQNKKINDLTSKIENEQTH